LMKKHGMLPKTSGSSLRYATVNRWITTTLIHVTFPVGIMGVPNIMQSVIWKSDLGAGKMNLREFLDDHTAP